MTTEPNFWLKLSETIILRLRAGALTVTTLVGTLLKGLLLTLIAACLWCLAYLLGWSEPPSLEAIGDAFLPVLLDVGRFVQFNLAHNLPFVLMAVGLFAVYERFFRLRVAAKAAVLPIVALFKGAALLTGLLTMAISLKGMLGAATMAGTDPRLLIGSLYYKFGLWVLTAIGMVVRYISHEYTLFAARAPEKQVHAPVPTVAARPASMIPELAVEVPSP